MAAGASATSPVDRIIDDLDASMKRLGVAMRDIPIRRGSFKRTHDNLARDVAKVVPELDAAPPFFRKNYPHPHHSQSLPPLIPVASGPGRATPSLIPQ